MANTEAKLVWSVFIHSNLKKSKGGIVSNQYGSKRAGCEKVIHRTRLALELNPNFDLCIPDAIKAYYNLSRVKALEQVKLKYPEIFNGLLAKYKDDTIGFYRGLEMGIELMSQKEGLGPGATETSWLYDLAVAPLIDEVQKTISSDGIEGIISTIIDDISIATTLTRWLMP